ncbi:MAG: AmmeMemoRadiSam system protein B [Candidatus Nanoarchaeia archaeon]|nr:AmmeMemoRadiSam system protein B [Candidatus Nanoarchaeia archaeon]
MWYPESKQELEDFIDQSFKQKTIKYKPLTKIQGLIVPHAGYEYSGAIAGKAFSLLKNRKIKKAIILGPSHYANLSGAVTSDLKEWKTSLGNIKLFNKNFPEGDIEPEHSIKNQVPFLQKLNFKEIMPLMIGNINNEQAKEIAEKISKIKAVYIFSTDLSHFYNYKNAVQTDKNTVQIIESLDFDNFKNVDACGYFPLLIMMHLCKILKTKPHLIEYKNSGDVTWDKSSVVGYASFYF